MNYWRQSENHIYVAAHRGLQSVYPENTMPAFRAAAELGVDQIETDIHMTKDGELVLIHDHTVDRTTDGTGLVCDMTYDELMKLDAGIKKGEEFRGTKIPTFKEFMDYVKQFEKLTLDIELKEYPTEGREEIAYSVCDRVLAMIDEYGFTDRVVINTFSGKLHDYIHEKYGAKYRQHVYYPISHLGECKTDPYSYAYCCCMFADKVGADKKYTAMASKEEFDEMLKKGPQPWAGAGVRDEEGVDEAIACGAWLITCNNADVILGLLRKKGYHD